MNRVNRTSSDGHIIGGGTNRTDATPRYDNGRRQHDAIVTQADAALLAEELDTTVSVLDSNLRLSCGRALGQATYQDMVDATFSLRLAKQARGDVAPAPVPARAPVAPAPVPTNPGRAACGGTRTATADQDDESFRRALATRPTADDE